MDDLKLEVYGIGTAHEEFQFGPTANGGMFDIVECDGNVCQCFLMYLNPGVPDKEVIEGFQNADKIGFAVKYEGEQILLAVKIGDLPWFDCVYDPIKSVQINIDDLKKACDKETEGSFSTFMISAMLIDSITGTIHALQFFTPDKDVNKALKRYISQKIKNGMTPWEEYSYIMNRIYAKYPTGEDIANEADAICWV